MSISQDLLAESIRTEKIIWLAPNFESPCRDLRDLFDDDLDEFSGAVGITPDDDKDLVEYLCLLEIKRKHGFLVNAATPVPTGFTASGHLCSWGYYQCQWFYTDSIDADFVARLIAWKNSVVENARKKGKP